MFSQNDLDQVTFQPKAGGKGVRIDFVLTTLSITSKPKTCSILKDWVATHAGEDHYPVLTVLKPASGEYGMRGNISNQRKAPYDKKKLMDPSCMQQFSQYMNEMPPVPFYVEPNAHAHLVALHQINGLNCCFPITKGSSKKVSSISDDTFQIVRYGSSIRKQLHRVTRRWNNGALFYAFNFWAKNTGAAIIIFCLFFSDMRVLPNFIYLTQVSQIVSKKVRSHIALDFAKHVEQLSADLDSALCAGDLANIHKKSRLCLGVSSNLNPPYVLPIVIPIMRSVKRSGTILLLPSKPLSCLLKSW